MSNIINIVADDRTFKVTMTTIANTHLGSIINGWNDTNDVHKPNVIVDKSSNTVYIDMDANLVATAITRLRNDKYSRIGIHPERAFDSIVQPVADSFVAAVQGVSLTGPNTSVGHTVPGVITMNTGSGFMGGLFAPQQTGGAETSMSMAFTDKYDTALLESGTQEQIANWFKQLQPDLNGEKGVELMNKLSTDPNMIKYFNRHAMSEQASPVSDGLGTFKTMSDLSSVSQTGGHTIRTNYRKL